MDILYVPILSAILFNIVPEGKGNRKVIKSTNIRKDILTQSRITEMNVNIENSKKITKISKINK